MEKSDPAVQTSTGGVCDHHLVQGMDQDRDLLGKVGFGVGCSGRDWDCLVPSFQRLLEPEPAWNIQPQICRDSSDPKTPVRTGSVFIRAAVNEFGVPQGFQSYPGWKSWSSQKIPEEPHTEKFQRT